MSAWRVIFTDSESLTGIAPVCTEPGRHEIDIDTVYDCCPGPHIECWSERRAKEIAAALTEAEAEVCP